MISDSDLSNSDVSFIAGDSTIQDYFNLRNERSLSAFDVPQRLVVSFDYQLPIGRGRTLGKKNEYSHENYTRMTMLTFIGTVYMG